MIPQEGKAEQSEPGKKGAASAKPHLGPALVALMILAVVFERGVAAAKRAAANYVHALAPCVCNQKQVGSALQREAFQQPDLLPVYGSSELRTLDPYHASIIFRKYPTGFTVFPIGKAGTTCLILLQNVAALGQDLHGKKLAVVVSPGWFVESIMPALPSYKGSFSRLHASELAFSTDLSFAVRHEAATRMLDYPDTLEADRLLKFALMKLSDATPVNRLLYYAALPLGKVNTMILRLQDHWETAHIIREQANISLAPPREEGNINWGTLLGRAEKEYREQAANNPFGFDGHRWLAELRAQLEKENNVRTDKDFQRTLDQSKTWTDLELLLQALTELSAQPLILSLPINERFYAHRGVSSSACKLYYEKLRSVVNSYNVPLLDFAEHGPDKYFFTDFAHPSRKGWVYFAQVFDAFYHLPYAQLEVAKLGKLPASGDLGGGYQGRHDTVSAAYISGWAWDTSRPTLTISVDIFDGNDLLGAVQANKFRPDLLAAGKGDGKHGFAFPTPRRLKDGYEHSIRIRISGTNIDLKNTPRVFRFQFN